MSSLSPSTWRMWGAYAVAPAVAPLSFVVFFITLGMACSVLGVYFNSASAAIVPRMAMTVGMVASYAVAGVLGMPIAFALRRAGWLSGASIHGSALVWCCAFALLSPWLMGGDGVAPGDGLLWFGYVLVMTGPSILLSATTFWLLVRE